MILTIFLSDDSNFYKYNAFLSFKVETPVALDK